MHAQLQEGEKIEAGVRFDDLPEHDRLYLREYVKHFTEQSNRISS